jgi:hypothetical protein
MSDFLVYAEKSAFDEIIFYGDYPNMRRILVNHASVFLNLSAEELQEDIDSQGVIFNYLHAFGAAKIPEAHRDYFENIYDDNSRMVYFPRSVHYLNVSKVEADYLKKELGIIVESSENIDDHILTGTFFKELRKNQKIGIEHKSGWSSLLDFQMPPSNAVVVLDNYLFKDSETISERTHTVGKSNIIHILDSLLPEELKIEYHVTLISEDYGRSLEWKSEIINTLTTEIKNLRAYDINVEIVFVESEHFHKRRIIMNYINASGDKGFSVFRVRDGKTVRSANDFRFNRVFSNIDNLKSDSDFKSATEGLKLIKDVCNDLATHLRSSADFYRGAIMGDCNPDYSLKNRLINDV